MIDTDLLKYASSALQNGSTIDPSIQHKLTVTEKSNKDTTMNTSNLVNEIRSMLAQSKPQFAMLIKYVEFITDTKIDHQLIQEIGFIGRTALRVAATEYLTDYINKADNEPVKNFEFNFDLYMPRKIENESAIKIALDAAVETTTDTVAETVDKSDHSETVADEPEKFDREAAIEKLIEADIFTSEAIRKFSNQDLKELLVDLDNDSEEPSPAYDDEDEDDFESDEDDFESDEDDFESDEDDSTDDFDAAMIEATSSLDYLSGPVTYQESLPVRLKTQLSLIMNISVVSNNSELIALRRAESDGQTVDFYNAFSSPNQECDGGFALTGLNDVLLSLQNLNDSNTVYVGPLDYIVQSLSNTSLNLCGSISRLFEIVSGLDGAEEIVQDAHEMHEMFNVDYHLDFNPDTDLAEATVTILLTVRTQNMNLTKKIHKAAARISSLLAENYIDIPVEIYAAIDAPTLLNNDKVRNVARSLKMYTRDELADVLQSRIEAEDFEAEDFEDDDFEDADYEDEEDMDESESDDDEIEMHTDDFPLVSGNENLLDLYFTNSCTHIAHILSLNSYAAEDEDEFEDEDEDEAEDVE